MGILVLLKRPYHHPCIAGWKRGAREGEEEQMSDNDKDNHESTAKKQRST